MLSFTDIEILFKEIERDKHIKDGISTRYPIRVIFLDDFICFREILSRLTVQQIDLSSLLPGPEKWFTSDYLIDLIRKQTKSSVIYPLSEIIRFFPNDKLQTILTTIFETQNSEETPTNRIYLPLVGLYEKFSEQFWKKFHRQREGAPIWRYKNEECQQRTNIFKLDAEISTRQTLISNNKEWLDFWKTGRKSPVINTASSLNRRWSYFQSDNCFESKTLDNIKVFLRELYQLDIGIVYKEYEKQYWEQLLILYESEYENEIVSFSHFLNQHFNIADINSYSDSQILLKYLDSNKLDKWLLKCYLRTKKCEDNYLTEVIGICTQYNNSEILQSLLSTIFELGEINDNIVQQRQILIESVVEKYNEDLNQHISIFIDKMKDLPFKDQIKFISGTTYLEKEYLIHLYPEIDESSKSEYFKKLGSIKHYLDWSNLKYQYNTTIPDWVINYFSSYNETKFLNKTNDEFEFLFNKINENSDTFFKWYYQINESPKQYDNTVVQIDALGMEWVPLIISIIAQKGDVYDKEITSIKMYRSNLPSITKNNKIESSEYYQELDILLHDAKGYKYPDTLLNEIKIIEDLIISKVLASPESKIYLTADHGATCHCLKQFGRIKKYNFEDNEHEGRYLANVNHLTDNESFINFNNNYIGLKHDSLNHLPRREVHGGATPEEVLIPLITIERKASDIQYEFKVVNSKIQFNNRKILIKVQPMSDNAPLLFIDTNQYKGKQDGNIFLFDISDLQTGNYSAKCVLRNQEYQFNFEIFGGIEEVDLF